MWHSSLNKEQLDLNVVFYTRNAYELSGGFWNFDNNELIEKYDQQKNEFQKSRRYISYPNTR